jgi:signal peptidase I
LGMAAESKQGSWKKYSRMIILAVCVIIGLLIVTMIFFKVVPGYNFYVVRSGSMEPAINTGDLVFTGPAGSISTGKIITFETEGETVTHRVHSMEGGRIITKGDANKTADTTAIAASDIKGGYLFKIPGLGNITSLVSTKKGWFLLVIVPAILLILFLVKDILKEAFKDDKKKDNKKTAAGAAAAAAVSTSSPAPVKEVIQPAVSTPATSPKQSQKQSFLSFLFLGDKSRRGR